MPAFSDHSFNRQPPPLVGFVDVVVLQILGAVHSQNNTVGLSLMLRLPTRVNMLSKL